MSRNGTIVGVLAVQGDFAEHLQALGRIDVSSREVRLPQDMNGVVALIVPGGESTTIGKLTERSGLLQVIKNRAVNGMPLWGTCAGMIYMAKDLGGVQQPVLGVMDIRVRRNAFGSQLDSFQTDVDMAGIGAQPFPAVFIRAPIIEVTGKGVKILAKLMDGRIVAAEQGNCLVTAFHPELTGDLRVHRYFVEKLT